MPAKCAIRFTDEERSRSVTVSRDRHGEPDQVILNLAELEEFAKATGAHDSPQMVAAQFLILDTLWYVRYHYDPDDFGEMLGELLSNPNLIPDELAEVLSIHTLGYRDGFVEVWYYELSFSVDQERHISYTRLGQIDDVQDANREYSGPLG